MYLGRVREKKEGKGNFKAGIVDHERRCKGQERGEGRRAGGEEEAKRTSREQREQGGEDCAYTPGP
jgi:hypothetical protein